MQKANSTLPLLFSVLSFSLAGQTACMRDSLSLFVSLLPVIICVYTGVQTSAQLHVYFVPVGPIGSIIDSVTLLGYGTNGIVCSYVRYM